MKVNEEKQINNDPLQTLISMGFDMDSSVVALQVCGNNLQLAIQMLLMVNNSVDVPSMNTVKYVFLVSIFK